MPADPSSRKQNRGGPRKWWREYYHDHPGTSTRHPDSQMGGSKVKVYCKECMRQNIAKVQADDQIEVEQGVRAGGSLFESYMIRLTASAGLPFSWIENPVWLSFCDEFLPSAKVKLFRTQAVKRTAGANATLQADGWTGINNHHLVAFMLTGKREVHAVRVIDTSSERKTADKFLKHIEDVLNETSKEWKVKIIAFTSDASGESRAARIRLLSRYPYLIILDCYAHQINLIVGDYLECKSLLLDVADDAEELITWLRKRTLVLARLRGVQAQNGRTAAAVIRPVKTRWTSHYLAFKRLLELQPAIAAILAEDQLRGESTFMAGLTKADAKAKARRMMELMNNGTFWHSLTRIKLHLEPLAIAANVAQTAHCRLDQVLLTFGFLYHRFSNLPPDVSDAAATSAVCDSIEERWRKADQAVFVAAVVLNPVYMLQPFAGIPELSVMQLQTLLSQLWTRFFSSPAPLELRQDLKDYLNKSGHFEVLPGHVESELKLAQAQVTL
ncbi:hypothetical protein FKP32DRAFT_1564653 [Trametes sanguinea]|nr:hypothetical protein FKP32DRAFT_1571097 [Trametes sanguinea]KAI9066990.1 hypothetical protein FKP32DRAFT_1564653 [Trametes sanguinea]